MFTGESIFSNLSCVDISCQSTIKKPAAFALVSRNHLGVRLPSLLLAACIPLGTAHGQAAVTSLDFPPTSPAAGAAAHSDLRSYTPAQHDALLANARLDNIAQPAVLEQLTAWLQMPLSKAERLRVLADSVVLAGQAGRSQEALFFARQAPINALPDYALPEVIGAARSLHDLDAQGEAVSTLRSRHPDGWQPKFQDVLWRIDARQLDAAQAALHELTAQLSAPTLAQRIALLELNGALAESKNDAFAALASYNEILQLDPGHRYATRANSHLLVAQGSSTAGVTAAQVASNTRSDVFSKLELAQMNQNALGERLRWAIRERDIYATSARWQSLDAVLLDFQVHIELARAEQAQAAVGAPVAAWRALQQRLMFDQLLALFERGSGKAAIALYEKLQAEGIRLPSHTLSAAAGAYALERRSDLAVPLYDDVLQDAGIVSSLSPAGRASIVFAYVDTGQFEQAEALMVALESQVPPTLRLTPELGRPNLEYSDLRALRALIKLYTDRPAAAERDFALLSSLAPFNAEFRSGQALTARLRQQPQAAIAHYEALLTDHPDNVNAQAGYAEGLLDTGEINHAVSLVSQLAFLYPESGSVRAAVRARDAVTAPRLDVSIDAAEGGGALANHEWLSDSRLTSGWLGANEWRAFYHQVAGSANTDAGSTGRVRGGIGLEWLKGPWQWQGELHQANSGPYRTGLALGINYRLSDRWRLAAQVDTNSNRVPWKALAAGIGAHEATAAAAYIVNESRRFDGQLRRLDYSDGNLRNSADVGWRERLLTGPRFQLEGRVNVEAAKNSRQGTPYFNPSHEAAVQVGGRAQYLSWKRDDRSFVQVLDVGAGRYRQADFGSGPLWNLRYEHKWVFGPALQLSYGVGLSSHTYDGQKERGRQIFIRFSVPQK